MKPSKLITFAVPCYNSEKFMANCIESLLCVRECAEIVIIDDGSTDRTGEIADEYGRKYPDTVTVHHQENGGHGEGVNQGIRLASGKYYKVVDSDDSLSPDELRRAVSALEELESAGEDVDMFVTNYVYVRQDGSRWPMKYKNVFPEGKLFTWDDSRRFGASQYLMMHSVIYRTELLREHGVTLPRHTFYVDNLYMYVPFPHVERIYYLDLDLYLYSVGSDEQSVSEKNLIKRIDQQLLVARLMTDSHKLTDIKEQSKKLYNYMLHELSMIMCICSVFSEIKGTDESRKNLRELWRHLKERDKKTYTRIRYFSLAALSYLPTPAGKKLSVGLYRIVNKIYKVN